MEVQRTPVGRLSGVRRTGGGPTFIEGDGVLRQSILPSKISLETATLHDVEAANWSAGCWLLLSVSAVAGHCWLLAAGCRLLLFVSAAALAETQLTQCAYHPGRN